MNANDVISASLRLLGVLSSGESVSANEATDGLAALNRMLNTWSIQNLLIYTKPREVFSLIAGTAAYTMGTGAVFDTSRPLRIENAELRLTDTTPVIERPIDIVTKDEFAAISSKTTQSTIPMWLYPEGTFPNETLNFWPVPSYAYQVALYSWKPLTQIAQLTTTITLPPGYEDALVYNLAVRLAPEYSKPLMPTPGSVLEVAAETLGNIKRMNSKPQFLRVDGALQNYPSRFNIYTGESR